MVRKKNEFSELPFTFLAVGTGCIARKTVFWLTVHFSIEPSKKLSVDTSPIYSFGFFEKKVI